MGTAMTYENLDERRRALVMEYINLARYLTRKFLPKRWSYIREDTEAAAFLGLVEGIAKWDPERGEARLAAYWGIRKAISALLYRKHFRNEYVSSGNIKTLGNGDEVEDEISVALANAACDNYEESEASLEGDLASVARAELEREIRRINTRCKDPAALADLFIKVHVLGAVSVTAAAMASRVSKQAISAKLKRVIPAWQSACKTLQKGS